MVPVREGFASTDESAVRAVASLARKRGPDSAPARYGQPTGPHNKAYYGRGHVQLTWRENYARSSDDAGVDLERDPDAMLDPVISARILIRGLIDGRWNGKRLRRRSLPALRRAGQPQGRASNGQRHRQVGCDRRILPAFLKAIEAAGGWPPAEEEPAGALARGARRGALPPMPRPAAPGAALAAWLAECPGDPRVIGEWLSRAPADLVSQRRAG